MKTDSHRLFILSGIALVVAICLGVAILGSDEPNSSVAELDAEPTTTVAPDASSSTLIPAPTTTTEASDVTVVTDPVGGDDTQTDQCRLTSSSLRGGDSGDDVLCLQQSLIEAGYLTGVPSGSYDNATAAAVAKLQTDRDLFVDGVTGRETALSLGIWPEEPSQVIRTPAPAPGAVDVLGYPLSSVATSGPDAPPLPPNSGTGRRLVYFRAGQRVWAVDDNNVLIRSWLVSGSKYDNEIPGTYKVYSRSDVSTSWNGESVQYKMVRWLKSDRAPIGFHSIPLHITDKTPYQDEAALGERLSDGCQRQATLDADFTWEFAQIGTVVVVI